MVVVDQKKEGSILRVYLYFYRSTIQGELYNRYHCFLKKLQTNYQWIERVYMFGSRSIFKTIIEDFYV